MLVLDTQGAFMFFTDKEALLFLNQVEIKHPVRIIGGMALFSLAVLLLW
jgi:hypothetical protein